MADGYARLSGRPGVCFTITGPGLTNIATAMGQAYGDSIPLLVISSQNKRGEAGSGRGFLHELPDQRAIASGVASASFSITRPEELPAALGAAFAIFASARPRPVYIEIPLDVLAADATGLPLPASVPPVPVPAAALLEAAATRLRGVKRLVILAGGGARKAVPAIRRLAEHFDAPVVLTTNGRGILPAGHPLAVPMSPSLEPVRALIAAADGVLAIGTEIGPTDYDMYAVSDFPNPPGLIHIEIDPQQLTRSATPVVGLCGDAAATLAALEKLDLGPARPADGAGRAQATRSAALAAIAKLSPRFVEHIELLDGIRSTLPNAVLVGDSTQLVYGGNLGFNAATPGSWFNSATGYGTLGYALPASTGAGLAAPDRPIVCLVGDGGLQFSISELAVLADVDAWTALVIWNNQGYGEIRTSMLAVGIEPEGVDVKPPEFAHIARAYGFPHRKVGSPAALYAALAEFGSRRQVMVIEIDAAAFA
jgi:acetolactate synthase-1/2/3 large subunit